MSEKRPILQVRDLQVDFTTYQDTVSAIRGASYTVGEGEVMAIVGESGSGKSVLTQTTVRLTPGKITAGQIVFDGVDLAAMTEEELEDVRGRDIGIIFQDAMTALNPTMRIGEQITEVLMRHFRFGKKQMDEFADRLLEQVKQKDRDTAVTGWLSDIFRPNARQMAEWQPGVKQALESADPKSALLEWIGSTGNMTPERARQTAVELLTLIKIPDPEKRLRQYIFQFSGGMRQRIMVAMALACRPKLLIADEPTTALDVTIKAEVLNMIIQLVHDLGSSIILITHDLGIVASYADRIGVMYAGSFVETGLLDDIFYRPQHPYTRGLLRAIPRLDAAADVELTAIEGTPPNPAMLPEGCPFHPRCECAMAICRTQNPAETVLSDSHTVRCWLQAPEAAEVRKRFGYGEVGK